uniref:Fucosyltransferase n=1 Tax=Sphenodon punctatus TaxID=8508 RepID=A0A8D0H4H2_SPHPU
MAGGGCVSMGTEWHSCGAATQFVLAFCLFTYVRHIREPSLDFCPSQIPESGNSTTPKKASPEQTILIWTWPFGHRVTLLKCSEFFGLPDCHITDNRTLYPTADAVIMHHRDVYSDLRKLPQGPRPPSQFWIWFNLESPSHSPNLKLMDKRFNMTMSYRRDSDIFTPYGWLEILREPQNFSVPAKSKLVAWVVSNWNKQSRRVRYYEELKNVINVDVYGRGRGHLPLPRDQHFSTLSQYKFYLAFENSLHEDYITEKLWKNALLSGCVPVVCGPPRANYERYLPPDSFIHIDDFPSAQTLAQYLKELDRDPVRYQRYFQWRSRLKPSKTQFWPHHFCLACEALQKKPRYQTVPSLSKWFV